MHRRDDPVRRWDGELRYYVKTAGKIVSHCITPYFGQLAVNAASDNAIMPNEIA